MSKFLIGDDKVKNLLRQLPKNIRRRGSISSGRKAAKPIVKEARNIIFGYPNKTSGNLNGFEHLRALGKATKTVVYKGGVNVQISPRTPDLPMASRRGIWNAFGIAKLMADGRRKPKGTGITRGFGDWVDRAAELEGDNAKRIFAQEMTKVVDQEIKRLM